MITVKGFSIVNEEEVDVFLELPCFLRDPTNVDNLISGSSAFSKPSLYIWKFLVHVQLKPSLKDIELHLTSTRVFPGGSVGKESACNVGDLGWKIPWRKEQLPTPVFYPGEFHGLFHGVANSQTQLSDFHSGEMR